jgi:hypothetical protein
MQKAITKVSGLGALAVVVAIAIIAVVVLVIVDASKTPPPTPQSTCSLVHHIVLPDNCVCSTAGGHCTPTATRPYLFFFTQAAACPTLACDIDLRGQNPH